MVSSEFPLLEFNFVLVTVNSFILVVSLFDYTACFSVRCFFVE